MRTNRRAGRAAASAVAGGLAMLAAAAALAVAGCDNKASTPSGTALGASGPLPPGLRATLSFERTLPADALGAPAAAFVARIEGAPVRGATLTAPDRTPYTCEALEDGALEVRIEEADDAALLARFPASLHLIEMTLDDGTPRSIGMAVRGGFPPFPDVVDPAGGATGVSTLPTVTFECEATRFDVAAIDETRGARTLLAENTDLRAATPGAPLAAGRAYRLEVGAESEPASELCRIASIRTTRFETAP